MIYMSDIGTGRSGWHSLARLTNEAWTVVCEADTATLARGVHALALKGERKL
jgi:hypothetical protein